jgi:16S rRNA C967 or C1407 C5-methylase (RsmB/RsmF family)/NOL1/NOP2/fmu family ribosome biogenesis protein
MQEIPSLFLENMQRILGDEYAAFAAACSASPSNGLRINTLKLPVDEALRRLPYNLSPIPWCKTGFLLEGSSSLKDQPELAPGKHPYHAAGLYYLQEPTAMAAAELLAPRPGERVLDLCAAPGGKATHLAALLEGKGLLVANETHTQRAWELAENLERCGVRNAAITNESPGRLAERLEGFFDRVLVDAPCSGEGMFRKSEAARRDWSPALVESCSVRQLAILDHAARLVRANGWLAYSTCTFNLTENESTIENFLDRHPDYNLVQAPLRLWPHQSPGEGHFIALLHRGATRARPDRSLEDLSGLGKQQSRPDRSGRLSIRINSFALKAWQEFQRATLLGEPVETGLLPPAAGSGQLSQLGSYLYWIPPGMPDLTGLKIIHPGWWLGKLKSGQDRHAMRFEPAHALALGLQAGSVLHSLNLPANHPAILDYLRGEILPWAGDNGWILVTVEGFALGWGKGAQGRLKNAYPRGLRWL